MLAEKLRTKSKTQLAKLTLGLRSSRLVSECVTGSDLIDEQSKILRNFLRPGAQDGTANSPGIFIDVSESRSSRARRRDGTVGLRRSVDENRNHRARLQQPGHGFRLRM